MSAQAKGSSSSGADSKGGDAKSDCKYVEAKGSGLAENSDRSGVAPHLELLSIGCGPSNCPVGERLELSMDFELSTPLSSAAWEIKFVVDSVHTRHQIVLGETSPVDYPKGRSTMSFEVRVAS
ncbi:unnamed protein product [Choristocarpus tenellus]